MPTTQPELVRPDSQTVNSADFETNVFSPSNKKRLLVIDWTESARSELANLLLKNSFDATFVEPPDDVLRKVRSLGPSLILLDARLLQRNGSSAFAQIRAISQVPIVVISDEPSESDCVITLGLGADDYIEKSASPRVLVARIRAALRRGDEAARRQESMPPTAVERFVIRPGSNDVLYAGTLIRLSSLDFNIFQVLFESMGRVVDRQRLLEAIRQPMTEKAIHALGMRVHRIRGQLERAGAPRLSIRCVRNIGYALTGG